MSETRLIGIFILIALVGLGAAAVAYTANNGANRGVVENNVNKGADTLNYEWPTSTGSRTNSSTEDAVEANSEKPKTITSKDSEAQELIKQLGYFGDIFENEFMSAYVSCSSLAVYNNLLANKSTDISTAFPEGYQYYLEKCKSDYSKAVKLESTLIAKPELVPLRKMLSKFLVDLKDYSIFAIYGGSDAKTIDTHDKYLNELRVDIREFLANQASIYK